MNRQEDLISLLFPTRGRPGNVTRLLNSAAATMDGAVEAVIYCDDDDVPLLQPLSRRGLPVRVITGPRITLSQTWNECYAASHGEIVMQCGDDIVFRSDFWDVAVRREFAMVPDRIALVWGDDKYQGEKCATHGFVHHRWVDTLGYFTPPYFSSDYGDVWLFDVAGMIGRRRYLPDVVTEHMHPVAGKAEWDRTHQERLARGAADAVDDLYKRLAPERDWAADKLHDAMVRVCPRCGAEARLVWHQAARASFWHCTSCTWGED